jgi:hypothetical protein
MIQFVASQRTLPTRVAGVFLLTIAQLFDLQQPNISELILTIKLEFQASCSGQEHDTYQSLPKKARRMSKMPVWFLFSEFSLPVR